MKKILSTIFVLMSLFGLVACGQKATTWQEQYDLGVRYLSEGNYEEAIIAFTAAIEIDPKNKDAFIIRGDSYISASSILSGDEQMAYLALAKDDYLAAIDLGENQASIYIKIADIYMQLGDTDAAIDILWRGYDSTGDETLFERADAIESYLLPMVSKVELYRPDGTIFGVRKAQYDDKKRLIRVDTSDFFGAYVSTSWETWEYDEINGITTYTLCFDQEEPRTEVKAGTIGVYVKSFVGDMQADGNVFVYEPFLEYYDDTEEMDGVVYNNSMSHLDWDHAVYEYNSDGLATTIYTYGKDENLTGYSKLEYVSFTN